MTSKKSLPLSVNVELLSHVGQALSASGVPAVNAYELGKLVYQRSSPEVEPAIIKHEFEQLISPLVSLGLLSPIASSDAFLLFGKSNTAPAEIACCIDPFAYVSHLSAMEHHGLTDRFPTVLYLTTPPAAEWRRQATAKMHKDLGEGFDRYQNSHLPRLSRPTLPKIGQMTIHSHERSQLGAFRLVGDTSLRVATIGRVFLDMLREPKLCGGIRHVLDIYQSNAKRYFQLITDEFERHGSPIDKVRAGYVLSTLCQLNSPTLDAWVKFAQRGGSRKLDSDAEYSPAYSAKWKLSINVPSLTIDEPEADEF